MRYNPYTGMGGETYIITKVHHCRITVGGLSSPVKDLYFKEVKTFKDTSVVYITEKELEKLQKENEEALKRLSEDA